MVGELRSSQWENYGMHRSKTKGETNYLSRFFGLVFAGSFASLISV